MPSTQGPDIPARPQADALKRRHSRDPPRGACAPPRIRWTPAAAKPPLSPPLLEAQVPWARAGAAPRRGDQHSRVRPRRRRGTRPAAARSSRQPPEREAVQVAVHNLPLPHQVEERQPIGDRRERDLRVRDRVERVSYRRDHLLRQARAERLAPGVEHEHEDAPQGKAPVRSETTAERRRRSWMKASKSVHWLGKFDRISVLTIISCSTFSEMIELTVICGI
jgi:hypothetical protein